MGSDIQIEYIDMLARYGMKGMSAIHNMLEYMEESARKHALLTLRKFREVNASFYILEGKIEAIIPDNGGVALYLEKGSSLPAKLLTLDTLHDLAGRNVTLVVYKGKIVNADLVMN